MKKFVFAVILLIMVFAIPVRAADVATLTWDNPTSRTDGSVFLPSDIAAFKVYFGTVNPPYSAMTVTVTPSYPAKAVDQEFTLTGLADSTVYYFMVSVVDKNGTEGEKSEVVSKVTAAPPPASGCRNLRVR